MGRDHRSAAQQVRRLDPATGLVAAVVGAPFASAGASPADGKMKGEGLDSSHDEKSGVRKSCTTWPPVRM
jgi:hypothetical protein